MLFSQDKLYERVNLVFVDAVNCQNNSACSRPAAKSFADSNFSERLGSVKTAAARHVIPLKDENYVFYIGHGDGQDVYVEYTEESTPSDPVVHITGHSLTGTFDFITHINDINPQNASYAELCALAGHQQQSGRLSEKAVLGICRPTPLGMQIGDFMQKTNYLQKSQQYLSSGKISDSIRDQGNELLHSYQSFADKINCADRSLSRAYLDRMTYELLCILDTTRIDDQSSRM